MNDATDTSSALGTGATNASAPIRLLLEHPRFVVVDKPPGLLSVPGKGPAGADCAVARVRARYPAATGPMVVHRLDMDTSGLLVIALDPDAQRDLSGQFERRDVIKRYVALLGGPVEAERGEISLPLRAEVAHRPWQVVDFERGREARTRFRVLARDADRTLVEFEPLTGRTHQIRVHAADPVYSGPPGWIAPERRSAAHGLGMPIVGDALYGAAPDGSRLHLHASYLGLREPGTRRLLEVTSEAVFRA